MQTEVEPVNLSDLGTWFGRMYPELLAPTKEQISAQCYKKQSASSAKKSPMFLCLMADGQQPDASLEWGGDWSIAWRVLDAQFWGVPQRRRRISLIADFGGCTAPEILFEREGVSGNTQTGGKTEESSSTRTGGSVENSSKNPDVKSSAFCIQGNSIDRSENAGCGGKGWTEDKSYTLNTVDRPAVAAFGISSYASNSMKSGNPDSGIYVCDEKDKEV